MDEEASLPKRGKAVFCIICLIVWIGAAYSTDAFEMIRNGLPMCFIVLDENASPVERFAAQELVGHLQDMTEGEIPVRVIPYGDIPETGRTVLLGHGDWLTDSRFASCVSDMDMLGDQGFVIRSFSDGDPETLFIGGRTPRGTLFAVYELLRMVGIRWYTSDITHLPNRKTVDLGDIDVSDLPCFDIRDVAVLDDGASSLWRTRLRLTAGSGIAESALGSQPVYRPLDVNVHDILPAHHFDEMPELFPLVDGERLSVSQARCLSSVESVETASDSLDAVLARSPGFTAIRLIFGDGDHCQCPDCSKLLDSEKSTSATALVWINELAETVSRKHAGILFQFDAVGEFEEPPHSISPSEKVLVRLNPADVDQLRFYEESIDERTMEFMGHLLAWKRLNSRILVSHPAINENVPPAPFPAFHQMFKNLEMYHYHFFEGCIFYGHPVPGLYTANAELIMWVLSELLWDRYQEPGQLVREWMKGVYGNASGLMKDYWESVEEIAQVPNIGVTAQSDPLEYLSENWLSESERILIRANALSLTDKTANRHVRKARIGLRYIRLLRIKAAISSEKSIDRQQRAHYRDLLEKWAEECKESGFDLVAPDTSVDEFSIEFLSLIK